jgi:dihydropteroate synthase
LAEAERYALAQVEAGADILDIGGQSTRPGSEPLPEDVEIERVAPLIERLAKVTEVPISADTYKPGVARAALEAGAVLVNDISGLSWGDEMARVCAEYRVPLVLMHIRGTPATMQQNPEYEDVVREISDYFRRQMEVAEAAGLGREKIVLDPGIGFGKRVEHNLEILRRLGEFRELGRPVLVGPSRKSFIGQVLGLPAEERVEGTAAAVALAVGARADIVRVHEVARMARVARMADAIVRGWPG